MAIFAMAYHEMSNKSRWLCELGCPVAGQKLHQEV